MPCPYAQIRNQAHESARKTIAVFNLFKFSWLGSGGCAPRLAMMNSQGFVSLLRRPLRFPRTPILETNIQKNHKSIKKVPLFFASVLSLK